MKHDLPPLESLKVFESAARLLSFSQAADELCITKAAVSYQISRLEGSLDTALFRRSIRQVYLTEAGQSLLQTTRRVMADLRLTLVQIQPGNNEHDVLIGTTTYVALRWLSSRIAGFSEQFPEITILLKHAITDDDIRVQDVDVDIRWGPCGVSKSKSTLLEMPMDLYPVCSPALLEKAGFDPAIQLSSRQLIESPLNRIPLLCEDRVLDLWVEWFGGTGAELTNPRRVIADANVRTQAAIDGQGWTIADQLMEKEIETGQLIEPFDHRLKGYGYSIISPPGRFLNRKAAGLRDWLFDHESLN
ncbi:MAG: LysR family glycine cleavage system transcriptional activator [Gammaproteobacteria bacterium]|jgi:LysR family glycine cleavage system transcriptional activator